MTSDVLPQKAGVGLKPEHYRDVMEAPLDEGLWVEVHPENYMTAGGPRRAWLEMISKQRAVSFHGVGLSLAGDEPLDETHLARWRELVDHFNPTQISEHVAWSVRDGVHYSDLLPAPATRVALNRLVENIDRMQSALGRRILIENPSHYIALKGDMDEPEFIVEACTRTGCGILLDVNNVFVSERNIGRDAQAYLDAIPANLIGEIHMAGHSPDSILGEALLIDSHDAPIIEDVWNLFEHLVARVGPKPTLIERDANIPPFAELMGEVTHANSILKRIGKTSTPSDELTHA